VNRFALREPGFGLSIGQLEKAFDCSHKTVQRVLANELEPLKLCGRQTALPDDADAQIIMWITRQAGEGNHSQRSVLRGENFVVTERNRC
jgi:hypothetical protein